MPSEGYWEGGRLNVACVGPRVQSAATRRRRVFASCQSSYIVSVFVDLIAPLRESIRPTTENGNREGQLVRRSGWNALAMFHTPYV